MFNLDELDVDSLDIANYPDLLFEIQSVIDELKDREQELQNKCNLIKSKIIVDIDSVRDNIGGRIVRKYSSQEIKEAKVLLELQENIAWMTMNSEKLEVLKSIHKYKNFYEFIRRRKQILLEEFSIHGIRNYKIIAKSAS